MSTLYLTEQGSKVKRKEGRIIIEKRDEILLDLPINKIERIMIIGNVQMTTQALSIFLQKGIPIAFLNTSGKLKGIIESISSKNVQRRIEQYEAYKNKEFSLSISRNIVEGKLYNQRKLIKRWSSRRNLSFKNKVSKIEYLLAIVNNKRTLNSLRGVEGIGSAIYFSVFGRIVHRKKFIRKRRPPPDPINALLSYGYTVLLFECISALKAAGLDPYIGFFHKVRPSRPALALDFLEEFRGPIVDTGVVELISRKILHPDKDFEMIEEIGGVFLKKSAKKKFFTYYDMRMAKFRWIIHKQSDNMAMSIIKREKYKPFRVE